MGGSDKRGSRVQQKVIQEQIGANQSSEDIPTEKIQADVEKASSHWFFLEREMVEAIAKGNYSLLPVAIARIDFLSSKVQQSLLEEGLKGEEEALWSIHRHIHNNGWWEQAKNLQVNKQNVAKGGRKFQEDTLTDFLKAHEHLIHRNTWIKVRQGDRDGIRMALNQIHYGSLMASRSSKQGQTFSGRNSKLDSKPSESSGEQLTAVYAFLQGYESFIEPSVLAEALNGDDKALSLALGQIHHHTLEKEKTTRSGKQDQVFPSRLSSDPASYKDVLLADPSQDQEKNLRGVSNVVSKSRQVSGRPTIFFTGVAVDIHPRELWQFFRRAGKVKDVILPRKPDRFGNKFGFLIMDSEEEVDTMIQALNAKFLGPCKLYLSRAKGQKRNAYKGDSVKKKGAPVLPNASPPRQTNTERGYSLNKGTDVKMADPEIKKESNIPRSIQSETFLALNPNDEMLPVVQHSLFLRTVKSETVQTVEMIVEGLGEKYVKVRGLSSKTFLAYFSHEEDFDSADREFLKIGFEEVREVRHEDLIPTRKAWVEIRGLPISGWTEVNFVSLLNRSGDIIHHCKTRDEEDFYQTPQFLLETKLMDNIYEELTVKLLDKLWKIKIVEVGSEDQQLHDISDSSGQEHRDVETFQVSSPPYENGIMNNFSRDYAVDDEAYQGLMSPPSSEKDDRLSEQSNVVDSAHLTEKCASERPSSIDGSQTHSEINPLTPRSIFRTNSMEDVSSASFKANQVSEEKSDLHMSTRNWKPREQLSSSTQGASHGGNEGSVIDEASQDSVKVQDEPHLSIIQDLEKLKVKQRRGRPRKLNSKIINRHFRLPKRKKKRDEGLQQITHFFINNTHDEAESIYESGLMMGLLPLHSKEDSLALIRQNLAN